MIKQFTVNDEFESMHSTLMIENKLSQIEKALDADPVDIVSLRKLSISPGGLVNSKIRKKVWPYLLDVSDKVVDQPENVREHSECRQVMLDVERSGSRFPLDMPKEEKLSLQEQLTDLILSVLCMHPELHYYQGYHDICITFLFVCGKDLTLPLVERVSTHHLRDYMDLTMNSTTHILNYLIPILEKSNPDLVKYILESEVGTTFAISWLITWFSYVLHSNSDIERLYDFFLSCHPLMPVYFAAEIVLENVEDIMDGDCDMARVYKVLLDAARKPNLHLENLISKASDFYILYPPSSLAQDAAEYYKNNLAVSTFCDYALVAYHESPDVVLQRRGLFNSHGEDSPPPLPSPSSNHWSNTKAIAVTVGGAMGAAAVAAATHLLGWGTEFISFL